MGAANFRQARFPEDHAAVMSVRDAVYVRELGLLNEVTDIADTYDRYDPCTTYFLAEDELGPAGTVKAIRDSDLGLPCDHIADLASLRRNGRVVEIGHLITMPRARGRLVGLELMRLALIHSVRAYRATYVVATFLADEQGAMREFYQLLGFAALGPPCPLPSAKGEPQALAAFVEVAAAARMSRTVAGRANERLQFFFHDYDDYAKDHAQGVSGGSKSGSSSMNASSSAR